MTKLDDVFSGSYLKATDLGGKTVPVTIEAFEIVEFDDGRKVILTFRNATKQLVVNKTNANTIAAIHGDELEGWIGKMIMLFPTQTDFAGKSVPCVRVKLPTAVEHHQGEAPDHVQQAPPETDIPF